MSGLKIDIPVLETERLRLRAPGLGDFEAEAAFYATERSKFVGGPMTSDLVWRMLASIIGHWVFRGYGFWAVDEKETGIYCGRAGLWFPDGWPEAEVSWTVMQEAEGKGIAREAAVAVRDYAYRVLGWTTAISLIDHGNTRSAALAERIGAHYECDYTHPTKGVMQVWRHPAAKVRT